MAPKQKFQRFQLVHRSHQDPLFHDTDASKAVLVPLEDATKKRRVKRSKLSTAAALAASAEVPHTGNLRTANKNDIALVQKDMKPTEGMAAAYGITYDDSQYDYLQHLRPMGEGDAVFIPANDEDEEEKFKGKNKEKGLAALLGETMLPSKELRKYDYQQQQDTPDEIAGFKPNLNSDLREALVALEDENYLDEEQDVDEVDVFGELLGGGNEISLDEYDKIAGNDYEYYDDDDDDDWDYDDYEGQFDEYDQPNAQDLENVEVQIPEGGAHGFDWEKDFNKFKKIQHKKANDWDSDDGFSDEENGASEDEEDDFVGELPDLNAKNLNSSKSTKKKAKRKKGAKTDTSSYSMSSSAMARTEQMTIIDDKYDVLKEKYEQVEDTEEYQPFDLSQERDDLMDLVDDFLDNYELESRGRRIVKKNAENEKYRKAALDVTKTKMKHAKKGGLRGIIHGIDELGI